MVQNRLLFSCEHLYIPDISAVNPMAQNLVSSQDRAGLPPSAPEKTDSVEKSVDSLMKLVQKVNIWDLLGLGIVIVPMMSIFEYHSSSNGL